MADSRAQDMFLRSLLFPPKSGEMRVFQRGRERQGSHRASHGRGCRKEGPPETWGHNHRTDFGQHR